MKRIVCLFVCLFAGSVNAALITADATADPTCGAGDPNTCSLTNFSEDTLSGVAGDTFEFIYTLNDMLHIQLGSEVFVDIAGSLDRTLPSSVDVRFDVTMALSDEFGSLLTPFVDVFGYNCLAGSCGFEGFPGTGTSGFDGLLFHDIHFLWTTSADTAIPISVGMEGIGFTSSTGEVGEWESVPEPATLALFGLGLTGLGFARKKRKSA